MKKLKNLRAAAALIICISLILGMTAVAFAAEVTYASSDIYVGETKADIEGYNISGNNYFKLRDLAKALSGTEKNFQVSWKAEEKTVVITPGLDYRPDGTESDKPQGETKNVVKTSAVILFDGEEVSLDAYNVNGYNYIKLRDVATLLDFALIYYGKTHDVYFKTDLTYADSQEIYPEKKEDKPVADPDESKVKDPKNNIDGAYYQTRAINEYSKYLINFADGYKIMVPIGAELTTGSAK